MIKNICLDLENSRWHNQLAAAYICVAKTLLKCEDIENIDGTSFVILFCIRHAFELYFKELLISWHFLGGCRFNNPKEIKTHSLKKLYGLMLANDKDWFLNFFEEKRFDKCGLLVKFLSEHDDSSRETRYCYNIDDNFLKMSQKEFFSDKYNRYRSNNEKIKSFYTSPDVKMIYRLIEEAEKEIESYIYITHNGC